MWANELVRRANDQLRQRAIARAQGSIDYLKREARNADVVEIRADSVPTHGGAIQNPAPRQRQREDYAFSLIDPAVAPDRGQYVSPRMGLFGIRRTFFWDSARAHLGLYGGFRAAPAPGCRRRLSVDESRADHRPAHPLCGRGLRTYRAPTILTLCARMRKDAELVAVCDTDRAALEQGRSATGARGLRTSHSYCSRRNSTSWCCARRAACIRSRQSRRAARLSRRHREADGDALERWTGHGACLRRGRRAPVSSSSRIGATRRCSC